MFLIAVRIPTGLFPLRRSAWPHAGAWKLVIGKENVNITDLQQVGGYAVKIVFDDGHNSGLYDWRYLYKLGKNRRELWDLYLERMEKAGERRRHPDPVEALEASEQKSPKPRV